MITALPELSVILGIFSILLIAGTIKGSLGIGFPAVAMSILPLIIDPVAAISLMAVPILVTNAIQFVTVKGWPAIVRRFLIAGVTTAVTIFFVVQFVTDLPPRWVNFAVGVSLVLFALASLLKLDLPLDEGPVWQVLVGFTSGLLGGISAVKAPIMIYAVGLKLPREEFICAAGFLFFSGGVGLVAGTYTVSLLNATTTGLSLASCAIALVGFRIGAAIRQRLSDQHFRLILLWLILVLGLRLILTSLF